MKIRFLLLAAIAFAVTCVGSPRGLVQNAEAEDAAVQEQNLTGDEPGQFELPPESDLPGVGPFRRAKWFQNVWRQRRSTFETRRDSEQQAVVFLGDSITQGWEKHGFDESFDGLKKANRGISGDTTQGMLYRLEQDVTSLEPAAVVMLMGTNDLEEGAAPESIASNVKRILEQLKTHNPEMPIVLCNVFPSSESKKRPADAIQKINELYHEIASTNPQITVVDTWTLFADPNGNAKASEFPDLLHPNAAGYAKWEKALRPTLATLGLIETETEEFKIEDDAKLLFNGTDLTGWGYRPTPESMRKGRARWMSSNPKGITWPLVEEAATFDGKPQSDDGRYRAIHGRLVVTKPSSGRVIQQLWTTEEFGEDFQLILEFRAGPNADSGIFLRGKQLQCRDFPLAGPYKDLKNYRSGDWNEVVISVRGTNAECTCNGELLEEAFVIPTTGPIGLEGDRGQMEYRRIRIRPLSN